MYALGVFQKPRATPVCTVGAQDQNQPPPEFVSMEQVAEDGDLSSPVRSSPPTLRSTPALAGRKFPLFAGLVYM
jgi:hypothetical protein